MHPENWKRIILIHLFERAVFGEKRNGRASFSHSGREDIGIGPLGVVGNLVGLVLAGWWLALGHLVTKLILDHRHSFCLGACEAGWTGSSDERPGTFALLPHLRRSMMRSEHLLELHAIMIGDRFLRSVGLS